MSWNSKMFNRRRLACRLFCHGYRWYDWQLAWWQPVQGCLWRGEMRTERLRLLSRRCSEIVALLWCLGMMLH